MGPLLKCNQCHLEGSLQQIQVQPALTGLISSALWIRYKTLCGNTQLIPPTQKTYAAFKRHFPVILTPSLNLIYELLAQA